MQARTFRKIALSLPDVEEVETWGEATFRVRNKIFATLGPDGAHASVKSTHDEQRALIADAPGTFSKPAYVGQHGWVGIRVSAADADEVRELLAEAWRMTATKRAVRTFDEEHG